ncbi:MAG TPA: hypothetical protein EYQ14_21465 [Gammaproteobacteria bacterium]|nr:hypothetical protein [Gammaproteobacteria bacterium]
MKLCPESDLDILLPHRPPMLMLTSILSLSVDSIHCKSVLSVENPLLRDDLFPVIGGVELLAQTGGAFLAIHNESMNVNIGVVVKIKTFQVHPSRIPVGSEITTRAHYQAGNGEAAMFVGEAVFNERTFFSGSLMIALLPEGFL